LTAIPPLISSLDVRSRQADPQQGDALVSATQDKLLIGLEEQVVPPQLLQEASVLLKAQLGQPL